MLSLADGLSFAPWGMALVWWLNSETMSLFQQVLGLAEKDRALLLGLLLESLEEIHDADSEALWKAEVAKRVEELDTGKVQSLPWGEGIT